MFTITIQSQGGPMTYERATRSEAADTAQHFQLLTYPTVVEEDGQVVDLQADYPEPRMPRGDYRRMVAEALAS